MTLPPQTLRQIPLFASLQESALHQILPYLQKHEFKAGNILLLEGVEAVGCYFLVSGEVRVYRTNLAGRIQVLARLSAGAPLNIFSLLSETGTNQATVEALTDGTALRMSAGDFQNQLKRVPDFSIAILSALAKRMSRMVDLAAGLSLYAVRTRLARFLIKLGNSPSSAEGWTQDEIAAQVGSVRDVIGRILRDFEASGLITREKQKILLLNRKALYQEADLDYPGDGI